MHILEELGSLDLSGFDLTKKPPDHSGGFAFSTALASGHCTVRTTGATSAGLFGSSELTQIFALYVPAVRIVASSVTVAVPELAAFTVPLVGATDSHVAPQVALVKISIAKPLIGLFKLSVSAAQAVLPWLGEIDTGVESEPVTDCSRYHSVLPVPVELPGNVAYTDIQYLPLKVGCAGHPAAAAPTTSSWAVCVALLAVVRVQL
jgi:hypothetical protein